MADRNIQDYLSSGEAQEFFMGGINPENEVHTEGTTGIISFSNSTDLALPLTTEFSKVDMFDTIEFNQARGHMTYDAGLARLVINSTGGYKFRADATFELANNIDAEFAFYINGIIVNPNNNPQFTGRGAGKNIPMGASRFLQLTAGDYLEIWANVSADNTLTIKASNISVEKTDF